MADEITEQIGRAYGADPETIGDMVREYYREQQAQLGRHCSLCNRRYEPEEVVYAADETTPTCSSYCARRASQALGYPEEASQGSDG